MRRALTAAARSHCHHFHHLQHRLNHVSLQCQSSLLCARFSILSSSIAFCSVKCEAIRSLWQQPPTFQIVDAGHYFDPPFWDSTYAKDPLPLEWYQSYAELSLLLKKYIPMQSIVLVSGCGNSELSADMVKDGYSEIVNIDISPVVIDAMKKKYQDVPQLKYMTMDVLDLSYFENASFDSVIDKGTLDAIMCVAGGPYNVAMMLAEINRILKPGGVYMLVSFAHPRLTLPLLNRDAFGWKIDPYVITKGASIVTDGQNPYSEPILLDLDGANAIELALERSDSLYIYMCTKETNPRCLNRHIRRDLRAFLHLWSYL